MSSLTNARDSVSGDETLAPEFTTGLMWKMWVPSLLGLAISGWSKIST
jgi:hypothetical protein